VLKYLLILYQLKFLKLLKVLKLLVQYSLNINKQTKRDLKFSIISTKIH